MKYLLLTLCFLSTFVTSANGATRRYDVCNRTAVEINVAYGLSQYIQNQVFAGSERISVKSAGWYVIKAGVCQSFDFDTNYAAAFYARGNNFTWGGFANFCADLNAKFSCDPWAHRSAAACQGHFGPENSNYQLTGFREVNPGVVDIRGPVNKTVDFNFYCKKKYGQNYTAVIRANNAYGWACSGNGGDRRIDVAEACRMQHGGAATAGLTDAARTDGWYCIVP